MRTQMNSKRFLFISIILLTLIGCNSFGNKEELVARIGGEKVFLSDLELSQKLENVNKNSTRFAEIFNEVILKEGMAGLARTTYPGISALVETEIQAADTRLLTMVYQQYFIVEMLGFKQNELQKYYQANKDSFPLDSLQTFNDIRGAVAKKLYLKTHADSLNVFIEKKLVDYAQPAAAEVFYVKSNSLKESEENEAAILAKKPLESIEGAVTINLNEKMNHEFLNQKEFAQLIFGDAALSVNADPKTEILVGAAGDTSYVTMQVLSRVDRVEPSLEDHLSEIQRQFIDAHVQEIIRGKYGELQKKFAIEKQPIDESYAKKYYDTHTELFKTLPGYSLYHIENSDSALLQNEVFNQVSSLSDFKKKAANLNQNTFTKELEGFVGHVKKSHSLPYGIGLIPQVFNEFEGKPVGSVSSVIKAANTGKYHVFYLEKEIPSERKSFDRVSASIQEQLQSEENIELDSSFVLVTSEGKPLIREKDLLALRSEIPESQRRAFRRTKIIDLLTQWATFALEAKSLGLDKSWEYNAFIRQTRRDATNQHFRDSLKLKSEFPEEQLESLYSEVGQIIAPNVSYEDLKPLLKVYLKTPEIVLKREYFFNQESYNSFSNFETARSMIFKNIASIEERNQWKRLEKEMWVKYKVTVYNDKMPSLKTILSSDSLVLEADSLYKNRQLNEARVNWELIRSIYPDNEDLFKKATFEIATIDNETENYQAAESEYRVFYSIWPNDPAAEKALFSRAFVLNENLKRDSVALSLFKEFQVRFPKSELKESVDWLIKNIESNGKLAEELVEKISQAETIESYDSTSTKKEK